MPAAAPPDAAAATRLLPLLRGALAQNLGSGDWRRVVLERRVSVQITQYLQEPGLARFSQAGPVTPDHVLRIKPWPLLLPRRFRQNNQRKEMSPGYLSGMSSQIRTSQGENSILLQ